MVDNRGIDTDPGWVNREFRELKRQIEALRSERRASSTTVGSGGTGLVIDGGDVVMRAEDGTEIFRIGNMEFGDRGVTIRREDGTIAFEVRKLSSAPLTGQSVTIYDGNEDVVVAADILLGGLRVPFLEHPFQPVAAASGTAVTCGPYGWERVTSSATFETLFVYDGKRQNPFLDLKVAAKPSDTTTAGEVRIVDLATGTPLPDFFGGPPWLGTIAAGSSSYAIVDPTASQAVAADAAAAGDYIRLGIQARRTAGAGSLTLAVPQAIGG